MHHYKNRPLKVAVLPSQYLHLYSQAVFYFKSNLGNISLTLNSRQQLERLIILTTGKDFGFHPGQKKATT